MRSMQSRLQGALPALVGFVITAIWRLHFGWRRTRLAIIRQREILVRILVRPKVGVLFVAGVATVMTLVTPPVVTMTAHEVHTFCPDSPNPHARNLAEGRKRPVRTCSQTTITETLTLSI